MDNISVQIYEYFDKIFKSWKLNTDFFVTSQSDEKYFYLKEDKNGLIIEFDITMDATDDISHYTTPIPELNEKGISYDYQENKHKLDDEIGKKKYLFDLYISNYFIRNFKIKKLFL